MRDIQCSKQAQKFLNRQTGTTRQRIIEAIEKLPEGDVKKLSGREGYRLRVGDYRVIFDMYGNVIYIDRINMRVSLLFFKFLRYYKINKLGG